VAQDNGTERPSEEADADGADRYEPPDQRVLGWKKELVKNE
jgi:hypothetical protein